MLLRAIRIVAHVALFLVLFVSVVSYNVHMKANRFKRVVNENIPALFPVLVLISDHTGSVRPYVVFHRDMNRVINLHSSYTYTVPNGQVDHINDDLARRTEDNDIVDAAILEVRNNKDGSQFIKVQGSWDDDHVNIGWYTSSNRRYTPLFYQTYFGPGLVLLVFTSSTFITAIIYLIVIYVVTRVGQIRLVHPTQN